MSIIHYWRSQTKNERFILAEPVITLQDIDMIYDNDLKEYLTINEVLCVLNDLHKDNLELKDTMKRMTIEIMGG